MTKSERLSQVRSLTASGLAKQIRLGARLSMADLASDVGVSITTIYRWEEGQRQPTGDPALRYQALLNRLVART